MNITKALFASMLVAGLVTLSTTAIAEQARYDDSITAAVQPSTVTHPGMADAQRALDAHLKLWTAQDPARYPYESLLADHAVYEFPYAAPDSRKLEGKAAIAQHLRTVAKELTDWKFSDVRLFSTQHPDVFFASFDATARAKDTGIAHDQKYMVRLTLSGDKIANMLVLWDKSAHATAVSKAHQQ